MHFCGGKELIHADDLDTRKLLEDIIALIKWINIDQELSLKHDYCPRAFVANTQHFGQWALEWGPQVCMLEISGRVFPSHWIMILQTEKFNLFVAVLFLMNKNLRTESLGLGGSWMMHGTQNSAWPGGGATNMGRAALWFPSTRGILRIWRCQCYCTINASSYSDSEYAYLARTSFGPRHQRQVRSAWLLGGAMAQGFKLPQSLWSADWRFGEAARGSHMDEFKRSDVVAGALQWRHCLGAIGVLAQVACYDKVIIT